MSQVQTPQTQNQDVHSFINEFLLKLRDNITGWDTNWEVSVDSNKERISIKIEFTVSFLTPTRPCDNYDLNDIIDYFELDVPKSIVENAKTIDDLPDEYKELFREYAKTYYNECVEDELDDINQEYAIGTSIEYETEYMAVKSYPILCYGDNCRVGGGLKITIKTLDKHLVEKALMNVSMLVALYLG
ncbi:MAG: hypothetical protein QXM43_05700 [Desulfurococcaceae archaeon]